MKECKEQDEEKCRSNDVHPDRVEVIHPSSFKIFFAQKAWPDDQVFHGFEPLGL